MREIQRYDFNGIPDPCAVIGVPRVDGEYIKYIHYDDLQNRVTKLEETLREIRDYSSYDHPDIQILNHRNKIIAEINECSACQHAKQVKWPPSGLCSEHYDKYHIAQRRVEDMHNYKQTWEPREIARRALEGK